MTGLVILILALGYVFFIGLMWWKIVQKTGYHGSLGLLLLVPVANIVVMAILAFKAWPSQKSLTETQKPSSFSDAIIVILIIAGLLPVFFILAAIAVPHLMMARRNANEALAQHMLQTISTSIETYAVTHKGQYPATEEELRKSNSFPQDYEKTKAGYEYSLNLSANDYQVTATPEKCEITGRKIFSIQKNGNLTEKECGGGEGQDEPVYVQETKN